jgi:hypothetical protein
LLDTRTPYLTKDEAAEFVRVSPRTLSRRQALPDHFVMHARGSRREHSEVEEIRAHGHPGRVTSVTVGKNPGRQVIVYDKRA